MLWSDLLTGMFLGILLLPIIYNLGLYLAMRGEFLIWFSVRALAAAVMVIASTDLWLGSALADPTARRMIEIVALDIGVAVCALFLLSYVEAGTLSAGMRRWLHRAPWLVFATTPLALFLDHVDLLARGRHVVLMGVIVLLAAGVVQALKRGSRAARFHVVAWLLILGSSAVAVGHEILFNAELEIWIELIILALTVEIIFTSIGVSDRVIMLKRERDAARLAEREKTRAAETDPLTGVFNRRGLDMRFDAARRSGPVALAIVDLDHFKAVNDRFGHDIGDEALQAAAAALSGGERIVARLGGEEFAILTSGSLRELDAARAAIPEVVAERVPALPIRVSASMGLTRPGPDDSLTTALKRADQALYHAKATGRDRTVDADLPSQAAVESGMDEDAPRRAA
ncbi:MAG: diguanylate cyclase [Pseudomonadota bacterium]